MSNFVIKWVLRRHGSVVEHVLGKNGVAGSIPAVGSQSRVGKEKALQRRVKVKGKKNVAIALFQPVHNNWI